MLVGKNWHSILDMDWLIGALDFSNAAGWLVLADGYNHIHTLNSLSHQP